MRYDHTMPMGGKIFGSVQLVCASNVDLKCLLEHIGVVKISTFT